MSRFLKPAFLFTALAITPLWAEVNFSGTWRLNTSKSQYGQFPAPEAMTRTVQYKNAVLAMSTYQKGAQGEVTTELKYTTDGKASVNGGNTGTAHWEGNSLVIESSRQAQGATLTQRDQWTLSSDTKTLTVMTHVKLPNGDFDVKQVFEKAPDASGGSGRAKE